MTTAPTPRTPLPPFTRETAAQQARLAEDAWNTRHPQRVAQADTVNTLWRNRAKFPVGRAQVQAFLEREWARELDDRLIKELWAHDGHRIAVRFASISDKPISAQDSKFHWPQGRWLDDHPGLNELGL